MKIAQLRQSERMCRGTCGRYTAFIIAPIKFCFRLAAASFVGSASALLLLQTDTLWLTLQASGLASGWPAKLAIKCIRHT